MSSVCYFLLHVLLFFSETNFEQRSLVFASALIEWTDGMRLLQICWRKFMNNLIKVDVMLAFIAAGTGQLPRIIKEVRIAQLKLLKESQASKWPKAWVPK
jgi:hypothetical protein